MHHDRLELPTGQLVTAQQIVTGIALLKIVAMSDLEVAGRLLKLARVLSKLMTDN